jgi:HD-GYP domain-containing protein (c-di-GMP phosphodiesterase class II)
MNALQSLAHGLEATDRFMTGHSMRVSAFARAIAHEMQLDDETVHQIGFAGELHDIGMTCVPQNLFIKAGLLTDEEYRLLMRHTIVGEEMVEPLPLKDPTMRQVVRWHHERFDGTGGPDHLSGENIPLAARIVSVSDAFDAMTSERPFRPAMPIGLARYELRRQAGTSFDPACVTALETILSRTQPDPATPDQAQIFSERQLCTA